MFFSILPIGEKGKSTISVTPRSVAAFLVQLIEHDDAKLILYKKEEKISSPYFDMENFDYGCHEKEETIEYPAIYFPGYWYIPDGLNDDVLSELIAEWTQAGNETSMHPVNEFLNHFQEIFAIYKNGGLSEDTYRSVLSDMLNRLRD